MCIRDSLYTIWFQNQMHSTAWSKDRCNNEWRSKNKRRVSRLSVKYVLVSWWTQNIPWIQEWAGLKRFCSLITVLEIVSFWIRKVSAYSVLTEMVHCQTKFLIFICSFTTFHCLGMYTCITAYRVISEANPSLSYSVIWYSLLIPFYIFFLI